MHSDFDAGDKLMKGTLLDGKPVTKRAYKKANMEQWYIQAWRHVRTNRASTPPESVAGRQSCNAVGLCIFFMVWLAIGPTTPDDAKKIQYTWEQVDTCGDPFEERPSVPAPIRRVRRHSCAW